MSAGGFYILHRGWMTNPALGGRRDAFCKRAAWAWLIESAAWEDKRIAVAGRTQLLRRGQLSFSQRFLAEAWGWSLGAVQRWLDRLKTESMIDTATESGQLVITICNYSQYQCMPGFSESAYDTASGSEPSQERVSTESKTNPLNQGNQLTLRNPSDSFPEPDPAEGDPDGQAVVQADLLTAPNVVVKMPLPVDRALAAWNRVAGDLDLPVVQKFSPDRRRKLAARLKECGGIDGWAAVLDAVRASDFLAGRSKPGPGYDKPFRCTFDWLVTPKNFVGVLEGNHANRGRGAKANPFDELDDAMRSMGVIHG